MSSRSSGFRSALVNPYLWGGIVALVLAGLVLYLLFNNLFMPAYTHYGEAAPVADVINTPEEEAVARLEADGLVVERVEERFNPQKPRDVVVDQNPAAGTPVKPGRRIFITVNTGRVPNVVVPTVLDLSIREAQNRLRAVGLRVAEMLPDSIPSPYPNTVTRQQPLPGDSLSQGSGMMLWYSTGLGNEYVRVPELVGMSVAEANLLLLELKLRPILVGERPDEEVEGQTVLRQSREEGSLVRQGYEVRLFLDAEEGPESDDGLVQ